MKDSEFLAEVKAREELEQRGYQLVECKPCNGTGWDAGIVRQNDEQIRKFMPCFRCDSRGKVWQAPMTNSEPSQLYVIHLNPRDRTAFMPCCGKGYAEINGFDRITDDPERVTCKGNFTDDSMAQYDRLKDAKKRHSD